MFVPWSARAVKTLSYRDVSIDLKCFLIKTYLYATKNKQMLLLASLIQLILECKNYKRLSKHILCDFLRCFSYMFDHLFSSL